MAVRNTFPCLCMSNHLKQITDQQILHDFVEKGLVDPGLFLFIKITHILLTETIADERRKNKMTEKGGLNNYSLINVAYRRGKEVNGYWLQDCNAVTFQEAVREAIETERVNGNRISVAVTKQVAGTRPSLAYHMHLTDLREK